MHLSLYFLTEVFFLTSFFTHGTLGNNVCMRDGALGEMRRLEALKKDILQRLGFEAEPPNPLNISDVPPEFLEEYEAIVEAQKLDQVHKPCVSLDFSTKEVTPFYPVEVVRVPPNYHTSTADDCASDPSVTFYNKYNVKFNIDLSGKDFITNAQLRMRKFPLRLEPDKEATTQRALKDRIDVRLISYSDYYYNESLPFFIAAKHISADDISGLEVIDVTKAIASWLEMAPNYISHNGVVEFEIRLRCPSSLVQGNTFVPNFQFFEESDQDGVLVLTTYEEDEHQRRKRQEISDELVFCSQGQMECCLHELRINFWRDFNWTWVIRPRDIAFNYCDGGCPIKWGLESEHSKLLDMLRSKAKKNPTSAPEPCCIPNSYLEVPLAITVRGRHSVQHMSDFVVTSCQCR